MAATEANYTNSQVKKAGKYRAKFAQAYRADRVDVVVRHLRKN